MPDRSFVTLTGHITCYLQYCGETLDGTVKTSDIGGRRPYVPRSDLGFHSALGSPHSPVLLVWAPALHDRQVIHNTCRSLIGNQIAIGEPLPGHAPCDSAHLVDGIPVADVMPS